jgi:hypothetical protein
MSMKLHILTTLLFSAATFLAGGGTHAQRHHQHQYQYHAHAHHHDDVMALARRQLNDAAGPASSSGVGISSSRVNGAMPTESGSGQAPTMGGRSSGLATGSVSRSGSTIPTPVVSVPPGGQNGAPPLSLISSGMPSGTPSPLVSTYAAGATPPIPGAPPLPTPCTSHPSLLPSRFFFPVLLIGFCQYFCSYIQYCRVAGAG